jgi:hypothetical protein
MSIGIGGCKRVPETDSLLPSATSGVILFPTSQRLLPLDKEVKRQDRMRDLDDRMTCSASRELFSTSEMLNEKR